MKFFRQHTKHAGFHLMALRVVVGAIFIAHGSLKFAMWSATPSADLPAAMLWLMRALSVIEPLAGIALILGLWVPIMAIIFIVIMIGAILFKIFMLKAPFVFPTGAAGWEFELLLLIAAKVLLSHGGGKFTIQQFLPKKGASTPTDNQSGQPPM